MTNLSLTTKPISVETAKTKTTGKLKSTCLALFTALSLFSLNASAQKQNLPETNKSSIEFVVSTPTQPQDSSSILYDNITGLEDGEKRNFTKDEILKAIKNVQEIMNDTNINVVINENLYKSLLENEEIQQIIQEMKNSDDIKKAFIEGNYAIIQDTIKGKLDEKFDRSNLFLELMGSMFIALIIFFLLVSMCMSLSEETEKK